MNFHEMTAAEYRAKFAPPDDPQTEMDAASYQRLLGNPVSEDHLVREKRPRQHPELDWRRQVVNAAMLAGWRCYWTWNSVNSPAGFPDLVLAKPGRPLILAELKAEHGRLSDDQRVWLAVLAEVPGVIAEVWKPADWDHVLEVLHGG